MEKEKNERGRGRPKQCKRTKEQIEYDTAYCTNLFLRGHTYRDIAAKLKEHHMELGVEGYTISHVQVMKDMQRVQIQWKKDRLDSVDDYVQRELEKLDKIEAEAWAAWESSKFGKVRKKSRNLTGKKVAYVDDSKEGDEDATVYDGFTEEGTETSSGNPKFMDVILNAMQRRAKLLGLDSPEKVDMINDRAGAVERPTYLPDDINPELLFQLVDGMQEKAYQQYESTKDLPN